MRDRPIAAGGCGLTTPFGLAGFAAGMDWDCSAVAFIGLDVAALTGVLAAGFGDVALTVLVVLVTLVLATTGVVRVTTLLVEVVLAGVLVVTLVVGNLVGVLAGALTVVLAMGSMERI